MSAYPDNNQYLASADESVLRAGDAMDRGNELLNRAKEVSQTIEERVRALCEQRDWPS